MSWDRYRKIVRGYRSYTNDFLNLGPEKLKEFDLNELPIIYEFERTQKMMKITYTVQSPGGYDGVQ